MQKPVLFIVLLTGLAAGCNTSRNQAGNCIDESKIDPNRACIEVYDPVCGCDGKTYPNTCYAGMAGVTSYQKGECP